MKPDTLSISWRELASHHGDASCCCSGGCQSCRLASFAKEHSHVSLGQAAFSLNEVDGLGPQVRSSTPPGPRGECILQKCPFPSWPPSSGGFPAPTARSTGPCNSRPRPPDQFDLETESTQAGSVLAFPLLPAASLSIESLSLERVSGHEMPVKTSQAAENHPFQQYLITLSQLSISQTLVCILVMLWGLLHFGLSKSGGHRESKFTSKADTAGPGATL